MSSSWLYWTSSRRQVSRMSSSHSRPTEGWMTAQPAVAASRGLPWHSLNPRQGFGISSGRYSDYHSRCRCGTNNRHPSGIPWGSHRPRANRTWPRCHPSRRLRRSHSHATWSQARSPLPRQTHLPWIHQQVYSPQRQRIWPCRFPYHPSHQTGIWDSYDCRAHRRRWDNCPFSNPHIWTRSSTVTLSHCCG